MKKLFATLLTCAMVISTIVVPVSADEIDYTCYIGNWTGNDTEIKIKSCDNSTMDFWFRYGQFAVDVENARIDGTKVYGEYYEVWDDGVMWNNYVMLGDITLELSNVGIQANWSGYENHNKFEHKFSYNNPNFVYRTIPISVKIDGQNINFDVKPQIIQDRTMVPMRVIFEALGYNVDWNATERKIIANKSGNVITMQIDNTAMYYNDKLITLDVAPMIIDDRTLVPVRAISESSGYDVNWDGNTRTVYISQNSGISKNEIDYSKYIGNYSVTDDEGTRYESTLKLDIYEIDGNTINFNCTLRPPRHEVTMTADLGYFINATTAEATGVYDIDGQKTNIKYYFVFGDDYIDFRYIDTTETWINQEYTRFYINN